MPNEKLGSGVRRRQVLASTATAVSIGPMSSVVGAVKPGDSNEWTGLNDTPGIKKKFERYKYAGKLEKALSLLQKHRIPYGLNKTIRLSDGRQASASKGPFGHSNENQRNPPEPVISPQHEYKKSRSNVSLYAAYLGTENHAGNEVMVFNTVALT